MYIIASKRVYENFILNNIFLDQSLLLIINYVTAFFLAIAIHPLYVLLIICNLLREQ